MPRLAGTLVLLLAPLLSPGPGNTDPLLKGVVFGTPASGRGCKS